MNELELKNIVEAVIMAAEQPLSMEKILAVFADDAPHRNEIRNAILQLQNDYMVRGVELRELSSGYQFQTREQYARWVNRLWEEKTPRFSRAFLETLALVAYRQPITRAEIEEIRGVAVNSSIIRVMQDRGWLRVVGHKDVPGRPELLATTREFLDYFQLRSLEDLPSLVELHDLEMAERKLKQQTQVDLFGDESSFQKASSNDVLSQTPVLAELPADAQPSNMELASNNGADEVAAPAEEDTDQRFEVMQVASTVVSQGTRTYDEEAALDLGETNRADASSDLRTRPPIRGVSDLTESAEGQESLLSSSPRSSHNDPPDFT